MGTASRKTWLEKQTDDVQFDVINWDAAAWTIEQMCAALKERHELTVGASTLGYSLQALHTDGGVRMIRMLNSFLKRNPDIKAETLTKAYQLSQAASEEFRKAKMQPEDLIMAVQMEKKLDLTELRGKLEERRVAAIEERNRLALVQLELDKRRVELLERKLPKVKDAVEKAVADEKASPEEVRRRVREIFGIFESTGGSNSASALPGEVGAG